MSNLQPKVAEVHLRLSDDQIELLTELFTDAGLDVAFTGTAKGEDCKGDFTEEWEDLETQMFRSVEADQ